MEPKDHILRINNKLQQLLKQHELLVKEHSAQRETISRLQQEQHLLNDKLNTCMQQNLILRASLPTMDPKDKKELEQKINQYVKNIDQCISFLSR